MHTLALWSIITCKSFLLLNNSYAPERIIFHQGVIEDFSDPLKPPLDIMSSNTTEDTFLVTSFIADNVNLTSQRPSGRYARIIWDHNKNIFQIINSGFGYALVGELKSGDKPDKVWSDTKTQTYNSAISRMYDYVSIDDNQVLTPQGVGKIVIRLTTSNGLQRIDLSLLTVNEHVLDFSGYLLPQKK